MKTSLHGICAILAHEAIVLSTYDDGTGTATIGAGHTASAGAPIPTSGMTISLAEAFNIFRHDLEKHERQVCNAVSEPLTQNQFDAVVSWHFNTGRVGNATLTDKLNAADYAGAAKEFARWNKAGGRVMKGLVARRERETKIFVSADYGDHPVAIMDRKGGPVTSTPPQDIIKRLTATKTDADKTTSTLLANPKSALLPRHRPDQSPDITRQVVRNFAQLIPSDRQTDQVMLVAVRGFYAGKIGTSTDNARNLYDDAIFVVEPDAVHNFNGNTDPSRHRAGIAKLKAPQAVRYVPGPHGFSRKGGPYPAFRQDSPCTVQRDKAGEETGIFWINLHRGGLTTTSSAGCQTIPPHQWPEFKALVDGLLAQYGQKTFYYLLVDLKDVPALADTSVGQNNVVAESWRVDGNASADIVTHLQAILTILSPPDSAEDQDSGMTARRAGQSAIAPCPFICPTCGSPRGHFSCRRFS